MPLSNLGFETDDAGTPGVGLPEAWTVSITTAAEQVAVWGAGVPPLDEEGFEIEWDNDAYLFAFGLSDTTPPILDTDVAEGEAIEDFEEGWSNNQGYIFELDSGEDAAFDVAISSQLFEDFADGWDSLGSAGNAYLLTLSSSTGASFNAGFSPQSFETFADGWDHTQVAIGNAYSFTLGSSTAASFDGVAAPEAFEDFEEVRTELQVTADPSTNTLTAAALHGFGVGDRVSFRVSNASPGVLPAGLNSSFIYHVLSAGLTTTEFRVSTSAGGTAIDITDAGVGTFYLVHDRSRYWVITAP